MAAGRPEARRGGGTTGSEAAWVANKDLFDSLEAFEHAPQPCVERGWLQGCVCTDFHVNLCARLRERVPSGAQVPHGQPELAEAERAASQRRQGRIRQWLG